mgnify:CR=1 FL=1
METAAGTDPLPLECSRTDRRLEQQVFYGIWSAVDLLAAQWLCVLGTLSDPKRENHPNKLFQLVLWIIPVISALLHAVVYAVALGNEVAKRLYGSCGFVETGLVEYGMEEMKYKKES